MDKLNLKDIKPLMEIVDYSSFVLLFFIVLIVSLLGYFIYEYLKKKFEINQRDEYIKILKNIDMNDSKKSAYTITKYATLVAITEVQEEKFEELQEALLSYKYKKEVSDFDEQTKKLFYNFMDIIDDK